MFVMRDGQIRRPQLSDVKAVAERDERIHQLEELNKILAAEVDAQRPLVDAACKWSDDYDDGADDDLLLTEVTEYYGRKAAYQVSKPK